LKKAKSQLLNGKKDERFASLDEGDLDELVDGAVAKSTKYATKTQFQCLKEKLNIISKYILRTSMSYLRMLDKIFHTNAITYYVLILKKFQKM